MAACEACWAIYTARSFHQSHVTYLDVLAEFQGKHTPEEMCGDLHVICRKTPDGTGEQCQCGKNVKPTVELEQGGPR
jgi:hypothetical protein